MKGLQALTKLKAISLLHKTKGKEGVLSAYLGQNIQKYKLENIRSSKILQNTYKPGGGQEDRDNVYIIFQQFFDLPISQTYYTYKFTNIEGTIQSVGGFFDGKKNTFTVEDSCLGFYAAYFSIDERQTGHAVAFYTCGGRDFYFNDNVGTIQFPWRKFLYHFTDKKTEAMLTGESLFVN
jgi:hypothetical protein